MIDIPILARGMTGQARRYLRDRPGVFEVHFCDDEVVEIGPSPLWRFADDWQLRDEMEITDDMHRQQFVGIVGDGAVVLFMISSAETAN